MNRTMNAEGTMGSGAMPMMRMMMECASMMEGTSGNGATSGDTGGPTGSSSMMHEGRMGTTRAASVDVATAEAVALAYLHGRSPERVRDVEILDAVLEAGRYAVRYRLGGTQSVVLVDAATGMIVSEAQ